MKKDENIEAFCAQSSFVRINGIRYLTIFQAAKVLGMTRSGLENRIKRNPKNQKKIIPIVLINDRYFLQESTVYIEKRRPYKTISYYKIYPIADEQRKESLPYTYFSLDNIEDLIKKIGTCKIVPCSDPVEKLDWSFFPRFQEIFIRDKYAVGIEKNLFKDSEEIHWNFAILEPFYLPLFWNKGTIDFFEDQREKIKYQFSHDTKAFIERETEKARNAQVEIYKDFFKK